MSFLIITGSESLIESEIVKFFNAAILFFFISLFQIFCFNLVYSFYLFFLQFSGLVSFYFPLFFLFDTFILFFFFVCGLAKDHSPIADFFLPATVFLRPFRVRALFLVFCPRVGNPLRCLKPR